MIVNDAEVEQQARESAVRTAQASERHAQQQRKNLITGVRVAIALGVTLAVIAAFALGVAVLMGAWR